MLFYIKTIFRKSIFFKLKIKKQSQLFFNQWSSEDTKRKTFYQRFLKENDLVFDVGANIGNRSKIFLNMGCNVIAIEPQINCVNFMKQGIKNKNKITFIQKAVGENESQRYMYMSSCTKLSSLSHSWISKVKKTNRFKNETWSDKVLISVTTLNSLIQSFSTPKFIKIDVEGYEYEVLQGLTTPVDFISFEFTPEFIGNSINCIEYLKNLGNYKFNFSIGESLDFISKNWIDSQSIIKSLQDIDQNLFGDIYAKLEI